MLPQNQARWSDHQNFFAYTVHRFLLRRQIRPARGRKRAHEIENRFDALGEVAKHFHLELRRRPLKTIVHLRRLLHLVRLYGRQEVIGAITRAHEYQTYDAAYVETILLQERRRRELPDPTEPRPQRKELIEDIDLEEPDPGAYDRFCDDDNPNEELSDE